MAVKNDFPLLGAVGGLVIALLVCIGLLAYGAFSDNSYDAQLKVQQQEYRRELAELERRYESKINGMQEQLNSLQFLSEKRTQILEDDISKLQRELRETQRLSPRY